MEQHTEEWPALSQSQNPNPNSTTPCWVTTPKPSETLTLNQQQKQQQPLFVESCKSTKGITVAVIDANAIIEGGERLNDLADKFVSVPQVLDEIRDPTSRRRLNFVPFTIQTIEPNPDALKKVIKFAKATGDLQTLSDVDLKLIALTYTLEAQIHGVKHLKECPPPVQLVNVKRLPEKEMPGWGNNVPNLEEWEALENEVPDRSNSTSRILPLRDLNLNVIPQDNHSENGIADDASETHIEDYDDTEVGLGRQHQRYPPKKAEVKLEGKKNVAEGVDASQGQIGDDNSGGDDWRPAVSRSTHRRFLRRKARRELNASSAIDGSQQSLDEVADNCAVDAGMGVEQSRPSSEEKCLDLKVSHEAEIQTDSSEEKCLDLKVSHEAEIQTDKSCDGTLSSVLGQMSIEEASLEALQQVKVMENASIEDKSSFKEAASDNHAEKAVEEDEVDIVSERTDDLDSCSQNNESVDISCADDDFSEQSWGMRSLSESSVACITGDFAMQNVILQMGLRLVAPGGMQIRQLHRYILKCHACSTVTAEIGRIFCPKCGNAGTLRKVAVTVNENGIVVAARKPRVTLRGTKFSLPFPQGGRDGMAKNLILREDQLPQKYLNQKTRKKSNILGEDLFSSDDIFSSRSDKKSSVRPPVRQALAVFSGKRNPNDNHYSRGRHNK